MASFVKVPVGITADQWTTRRTTAAVLLVVHNLTTLNRLADVAELFDGDPYLQIVATSSLSDPFSRGLEKAIDRWGLVFVPWEQAVQIRFDLIVTASHHGSIADLNGPIVIFSHGIGYTKYSPGAVSRRAETSLSREPGAGSREPGAGSREPGAGSREPGAGRSSAFPATGLYTTEHQSRPRSSSATPNSWTECGPSRRKRRPQLSSRVIRVTTDYSPASRTDRLTGNSSESPMSGPSWSCRRPGRPVHFGDPGPS